MRMRQSLADIESAFYEEIEEDRLRREQVQKQVVRRSRQRELDRVHRQGSLRFWLLVLTLLATAALVTVGMFQALYFVMG
ncbi:MAG TPA: hypothetical protein VF533_14860 [Solirubrobacteraceae bacterium]|jgi:hypothetical protein